MCPTLKLKWFSDNGYSQREINKIRKKVVARFNSSYGPATATSGPMGRLEASESSATTDQPKVSKMRP